MTEDLHSLVGVYALDALDPLERRRFEAHLERCDTCAVAGMVAAAAALASVVAEAPPAGLRDALLSRAAETRQDPPVVRRRPTRRLSRLVRVLLPVAAAIAVVVGVLAVSNRGDRSPRGGELAAIVAAPDAKVVDLRNQATDVVMRVVWSPSAGKGAVVATGLADPGTDRAYEMWAIGADGPHLLIPSSGRAVTNPGAVHLPPHQPRVNGLALAVSTGSTTWRSMAGMGRVCVRHLGLDPPAESGGGPE